MIQKVYPPHTLVDCLENVLQQNKGFNQRVGDMGAVKLQIQPRIIEKWKPRMTASHQFSLSRNIEDRK